MTELINILPLPSIWLGTYLLGLVGERLDARQRRVLVVTVSSLFLMAASSGSAWALYTGAGLLTAGAARLLSRLPEGRGRRLLFLAALGALLALLLAFLVTPDLVAVYFPYLPSLSYLVFRGVALLVTALARADVPLSAALLQMLFLPIVALGPITRVEHFLAAGEVRHRESLARLCRGLAMLLAGNIVGSWVLRPFAFVHPGVSVATVWLGVLANSFEIYFLFAGYTHLVIGLGHLLGFRLPDNFARPYRAQSVTDFWRRWHMSLSFFIRDYLYIPLGGSRRGLARKNINLVVAMTLCGLWHGLTPNYLLWGGYHGALLALESTLRHFQVELLRFLPARARSAIQVAVTFTLVTIGWIPFTYDLRTCATIARMLLGGW